ncbi:hypothetical protein D3C80_2109710 [compost metagenome]
MPAGIGQRHIGGCHAINNERIDLALFFRLHPIVRIERTVGTITNRNAASNFCWKIFDFEFSYKTGTVLSGQ